MTLIKKKAVGLRKKVVAIDEARTVSVSTPPPEPPPMRWKTHYVEPGFNKYVSTTGYNYCTTDAYIGTARFNNPFEWFFKDQQQFPYCCGLYIIRAQNIQYKIEVLARLVDNAPSHKDAVDWVYDEIRAVMSSRTKIKYIPGLSSWFGQCGMWIATTTPGEGQVSLKQQPCEEVLERLGFKKWGSCYSQVHSTTNPGLINCWSYTLPD